MRNTKQKLVIEDCEPSFVALPGTLFTPEISDRAFRLVATIIEIVGDDFYIGSDIISWTRADYEDFAESMGYSTRLMNEALREAASAGLITVEHAHGNVTVKRGRTLCAT
jgi:hypothetical protein